MRDAAGAAGAGEVAGAGEGVGVGDGGGAGAVIGLSCPLVDSTDRPGPGPDPRAARVGWQTYDGCFGCGVANLVGLHLCGAVATDGPLTGRYVMAVNLGAAYQGGRGVIHGGIQAVVLDEVFGQAIHVLGGIDTAIVTADFKLRYRRAAPVDAELVAVAWIDERRGSWFTVSGYLAAASGAAASAAGAIADPGVEAVGVSPGRPEGRVLTEATARWRVVPT